MERMPPSNRVLHALVLPESGLPLGNLVIAPSGIYAIDTFRAAGKVKIRDDSLWLDHEDLRREFIVAHRKAAELGRFMHHAVTPVLCFTEATLPAPVIHFRHVVVCSPDVLSSFIDGGPQFLERSWVQVFGARASALAAWPGPPPPRPAHTPSLPARAAAPTRGPDSSATRRQPDRRPRRRGLATVAATAVCIVGAWTVPALARLADVDQSVQAPEHSRNAAPAPLPSVGSASPADSAPAATTAAATAVSTAPSSQQPAAAADAAAAPAPIDAPELLPTLDFACPSPGAGWTVSAVGAAFAQDPVGYHLWYEARDGSWQYWGHFMSGLQSPIALTGFEADEELDIRIDRVFHQDAAGAPTMLMFTAPDEAC